MARGSALFASLFNEIELPVITKQRKGRSDKLNDNRNEALLARYYWYGRFTTNRYPIILTNLSREFYLSTRTIQDLIQEDYTILQRLKKEQPPLSYFKGRWPHIVWNS
jgi:hypothetical protein